MKTILTLFTSIFCFSIPGIAASDDQHWDDQFAPPGADNLVLAMTPAGSNLYAGGFFTVMGEVKSPAIMKWDGTNWAGLGTGLKGDSPLVYAIAVRGADVYVGGFSITNAGGISVTNLAHWNGASWSDIGGVNGFIKSMLVVSNDLYVAGDFTRAGGVTATNIARWDGANWWPLGNGLSGYTNGPYAYVSSMALDANGHVVAAGLFRFADGLEVNNIARWDGSQWHAFNGGAGGGPYPFISDVKVQGTDLYIAGAFQSAGGVNATNLARWDGTQWNAMGGGPSGTNYALAFFNGQTYTAGQFTNISGTRILNVARWDGAAWQP